MRVSSTELKTNISKYIERAAVEDIIITKNGRDVALLTNMETKKKEAVRSLRGIIKSTDIKRDEIREQRLGRYDTDTD